MQDTHDPAPTSANVLGETHSACCNRVNRFAQIDVPRATIEILAQVPVDSPRLPDDEVPAVGWTHREVETFSKWNRLGKFACRPLLAFSGDMFRPEQE
jgi:Ni,Fe-hydrogenase III component G